MMHLFRLSSYALLLASTLLFTTTACKKTEDPVVPTPVGGTIDGTFTPAGSIQIITVYPKGTTNGASVNPDPTGYFKTGPLTEGDYAVSFTASSGYTAPAAQSIHVTAGSNTALGTVKINPTVPANTSISYPLQGTVGWTSTGTNSGIRANATATGTVILYNGNPTALTLKSTSQSGTVAETVELYLPSYTGPALYRFDYSATGNYTTFLRTLGGVVTDSYNTKVSGTQGTATITAHDLTARTISGTFGYTGYDSRGVYGVTVSNGSFSLSY